MGARGVLRISGQAAAATLLVLATAGATAAAEVRFALTVDYPILQGALRKHLHAEPGQPLELWRTADGCGTFGLREATVGSAETRLRLAGPATATAGFPLFGLCWASLSWEGEAEILARPEIARDWQLHLRDADVRLLDAARQRQGVTGRLAGVIQDWAADELASFAFDLGPPVQEVQALLGGFAAPGGPGPLGAALRTLRPLGVLVDPEAVRVVLAMDVPPRAPAARGPEPALSGDQLRRWQALLDQWDGFLSFVVKDLGGANADPASRDELLDLLLDARRDVLAVLGRGPEPGSDPVRPLFLGVWDRLRTLVRQTAIVQRGDASRALRYVVFLSAGDALAALEPAAGAAGLEFSADGLRRLARTLDPGYPGDPLEYTVEPDPRLQRLFRFRDPDAPPRRPRRKAPGSSWWPGPRAAHAQGDEWRALASRLDRWVPAADEVPVYRRVVERLLTLAAERSLDPDVLDERFDALFHHLVQAVAWQESCWRQFVRDGDRVTYISSATGDVGLMQINVRVWRGFFSPDKLRWSAAYNAGAGAEILQHLLVRYGVREARERLDNAARATYSAYHGGPARYRRYRTAGVPPAMQAIDRTFWEKYRAVAAGQAGDRVLCLPPRRAAS